MARSTPFLPGLRFSSLALLALFAAACSRGRTPSLDRFHTSTELRVVRRGVAVTSGSAPPRAPYPRERLAAGDAVELLPGALAWVRRDGGASALVVGPAALRVSIDGLALDSGRAFVEASGESTLALTTPSGDLALADVRASIEVGEAGTHAYAVRGVLRAASGEAARAGESLELAPGKAATHHPETAWEDWTGGLATAETAASPAPAGVGTVVARRPEDHGAARLPLAVTRLDVRVRVDHDFAITEVDETFFNPTADVVEGVYAFRTPDGATLDRFGVDRGGAIAWGRVQETGSAAAQYAANVRPGSKEDPALLTWEGPGAYRARLYPIGPGETRRVVVRYGEWLGRDGARGERRLYVYPMAAERAGASLARIEDVRITVDLAAAGAREVRAGMDAVREGARVIVRATDLAPRADLAIELFDDGDTGRNAYRAPHAIDPETVAEERRGKLAAEAKDEADYVLVPVRITPRDAGPLGLDVALVVDASAGTDDVSLRTARTAAAALLAHLGPNDRVAAWAADASLRALASGSETLAAAGDARKRAILEGLARVERGGATDLGAVIADAASVLDPARRGVVVYVGDGRPTVGELSPAEVAQRLDRLARPARVFAIGVGDGAAMDVLAALSRAGHATRVDDAHAAASAALDVLARAERGTLSGTKIELGAGVDRVLVGSADGWAGESALVVGRVTGASPREVLVTVDGRTERRALAPSTLADAGDLRRRWAEARTSDLAAANAGRAALVELGMRYAVVGPYTAAYVPTARESANDALSARGDEGAMGSPSAGRRFGVQGPKDNPDPHPQRQAALREAAEFGIIGLVSPTAERETESSAARAKGDTRGRGALGNAWGADIGDALGAGGIGLSGIGEGGGGRSDRGGSLGAIGAIGNAFGSGHGRLGGPGGAGPSVVLVATFGHAAMRCSAASELPIGDRAALWRERIAASRGDAMRARAIYGEALASCEAPSWPERARLVTLLLDGLPTVTARVALFRAFEDEPIGADLVLRGVLARVRSPASSRELSLSMGLRHVDATLLGAAIARASSPLARVAALEKLATLWPDDLDVALALLDAYEDAGDRAAGRALARTLRRRPDATAAVRTAIGEHYLRLAASAGGTDDDRREARRTFGEIVELAPEDPVARRRLGDLLRAHGWADDAMRQYETLARLAPDDPALPLVLAAAAQAMGKTEEAARWTEKAMRASPGARSARAMAAALLAWGRESARVDGHPDEVDRLRERARELTGRDAIAGTVRVLLTWSHPDLRPSLWVESSGGALPAAVSDSSAGIAEAAVAGASRRVEIRIDRDDAARAARLGLVATLTTIAFEGTARERIERLDVTFGARGKTRRFQIGAGAIREDS